jgi:hypothetical protein
VVLSERVYFKVELGVVVTKEERMFGLEGDCVEVGMEGGYVRGAGGGIGLERGGEKWRSVWCLVTRIGDRSSTDVGAV